MIRNFFKLSFRVFYRRKFFFLINVLGLSLGFACCIVLFFYTAQEENYDLFHKYHQRIVRIKTIRETNTGEKREMAYTCYGCGPDIAEAFPEVEKYVRMSMASPLIQYRDRWFKSERGLYASNDFFNIFSFELLKGSDSLVLSKPYTMAISESFAKKVFGEEEPLGKTVNYKGRFNFEVTGVFADLPLNSHMDFEVVLSLETYKLIMRKDILEEPWRWDIMHTYLLLAPGTSIRDLEQKFPALIEEKTGEYLKKTDQKLKLELQPLASIHLSSHCDGEFKENGDSAQIFYLKCIAIGILLLAWINYISLATAKSIERAREVGVRKVMGSYRWQLIVQFTGESILLNILALLVAIGVIALVKPYVPEYIKGVYDLHILTLPQWTTLAGLLVGGSLVSALYPALVLSGFQPTRVLKGSLAANKSGKYLRKVLVITQFIVSLVLVIWIYVIVLQIKTLRSQPLGFAQSSRLVIHESEVYDSLYDRNSAIFKNELARIDGVEKVSYTLLSPGEQGLWYSSDVRWLNSPTTDVINLDFLRVDENFDAVLELKSLAGTGFKEASEPKKEIMINASAVKALGFQNAEDAIQQRITFFNDTAKIVRVLQDFRFYSPRENIKPLAFLFDPKAGAQYIASVEPTKIHTVVRDAQKLFNDIFPGQVFRYHFLDDHYNKQYAGDIGFEKALSFFSGMSIWITCLGLVGMAAYTAQARRKEIGIRKTLGASSTSVLVLLWREYVVIVLIAASIASPVAWYIANEWTAGFSVRLALTPWHFAIPNIALLLVTLLTVAIQTIRAARANPVDSIRYE